MHPSTTLLLLIAVATGMLIPLQPGINAELRLHSGSALVAALISFAGGTLAIALVLIATRLAGQPSPVDARSWIAAAPWWAYLGGLIGALFVTVSLVLAPRLGAAALVAGIVTGQLLGSVVIDHFGFVGFARTPISWQRLAGLALLILGVIVIQTASNNGKPSPDTHSERATEPPSRPS